jgi:hypothetical protein
MFYENIFLWQSFNNDDILKILLVNALECYSNTINNQNNGSLEINQPALINNYLFSVL